jgi:poly-gamma-glutamate synthesis protein (capsule biosynthesis protein)
LRVDGRHPSDADYPLQQTWSLLGADEYDTAVSELAAHLTTHWPTEPVVHLVAVGDVMLDRSLGFYLQRDDLAYPFVGVAAQLQNADITVGNVESSLGDTGQPAAKSYTFRAPPQAAPSLALAGFDVVSLANNHGMDYGPDTLLQGIQLLHDAGLSTVGAGANLTEARTAVIRELNGLRLAFLGYVNVPVEGRGFNTETWTATDSAPGLAWAIPEWISADVTAVRSQADIVMIILHSGYEYREDPSPPQIAAAQAAITAGADLVLGHHAHILQGLEFADNSSVIVYGLGNFAFEIDGPPETMLLNVWLDAQGVRELEIVPAVIRFGGQPRLADPVEANAIRQTVYRLTDKLNQ